MMVYPSLFEAPVFRFRCLMHAWSRLVPQEVDVVVVAR